MRNPVERARRGTRSRRGFTLLELIVVITIIGILGTLVVVKVSSLPAQARRTKITADLKAINSAAEIFYVQAGRYPESLDELKQGTQGSPGEAGTVDSLLKADSTKDPWGQEYLYELDPSGKPRVRCLGRDGTEGGEGDNQDFEESQEAAR